MTPEEKDLIKSKCKYHFTTINGNKFPMLEPLIVCTRFNKVCDPEHCLYVINTEDAYIKKIKRKYART